MTVPYYGDFAEDDTVIIPVNTFDSNDPAASVTVTNFANTDIHIHKDAGTTQRNNAAGITVSIDFDSITGNHLVEIDTSDNTVAGFYVTGSEYSVRVEGATVDGGTINAWIGAFSIERAGGVLALIKAGNLSANVVQWNSTNVATPTVAGVPEVDITHVGGSAEDVATETKQDTAQLDLDTLTGTDGATLATSQPNYAPNTTTPPTAAAIVNEWESQSQADPTGFHVNVMEINGTAQSSGVDLNKTFKRVRDIWTEFWG